MLKKTDTAKKSPRAGKILIEAENPISGRKKTDMGKTTVRFRGLTKGESAAANIAKMKLHFKGRSIFRFKNGDIYVGGFKVRFPQTIFRHGYGMYICEDDKSVYLGHWYKDVMFHGKIKYQNGITYIGNLRNSKYHGKGNYRVPGIGNMLSYYLYNLPTAEVALVDVNGFYWTGSVSEGGGVQLYPVNPFHNDPLWHENTSDISVTKKKTKPITLRLPITQPKISLDDVDINLLSVLTGEDDYSKLN